MKILIVARISSSQVKTAAIPALFQRMSKKSVGHHRACHQEGSPLFTASLVNVCVCVCFSWSRPFHFQLLLLIHLEVGVTSRVIKSRRLWEVWWERFQNCVQRLSNGGLPRIPWSSVERRWFWVS